MIPEHLTQGESRALNLGFDQVAKLRVVDDSYNEDSQELFEKQVKLIKNAKLEFSLDQRLVILYNWLIISEFGKETDTGTQLHCGAATLAKMVTSLANPGEKYTKQLNRICEESSHKSYLLQLVHDKGELFKPDYVLGDQTAVSYTHLTLPTTPYV